MRSVRWGGITILAAAASFVLVSAGPSTSAPSCTTTFNKAAGQWTTAVNWTAGVPTAASYACVPVGSTATLTGAGVADGVRIDGALQGAGTLTVTDVGTVSDSELNGTVTNANLVISTGQLAVTEGDMNGSGTTTVGSGASMRVTNPSGGNYGLVLGGTRSVVNNGTVTLDQATDTTFASLLFNGTGMSLTNNNVLDLKGGADIAGSGVLRVTAAGLVRSLTAGTSSEISSPVELAGHLDAAGGTLRPSTLTPAAAGSTTGVVTTSGGALELSSVTVPAGSKIATESTGVKLLGSVNGDGAFVVAAGTLLVEEASMGDAGTTTVASGASMRVTNPSSGNYGLHLGGTRSVVNNGTVTLDQATDTTFASLLFNGTGMSLTNNNVLDLKGGADIIGSGTLTNGVGHSLTKVDGPTTTSEITSGLKNEGLVEAQVGTLRIASSDTGGTSLGSFTAGPDAVTEVGGLTLGSGSTLAGPTAAGTGEVRIANSVTIESGATVVATGRTGLTGSVNGAGDLTVASGSMLVAEGSMSDAGTTTVGSGASMRVTNPSGGNYGLVLGGTRSVVNNGTVTLDQATDTTFASLLFNGTGMSLTNNNVLDLKGGADIAGSGVLRVTAAGLVRSLTAGTSSEISSPVELAGHLDAAGGTLRPSTLTPAAAGSTTGVVTTSGGALELSSVTVPAGSKIATESTGVKLLGSVNGDGAFVVAAGTLLVEEASMGDAGTTTVASGASMRVTNPSSGNYGLHLGGTRSVVNNGTVTLDQATDTTFASLLFNGTGMSLTNNNVLDLKGGADIIGSGTLTNGAAGTITKPDGPTTTSGLSATVDNFGTLRSESGLVDVTGAFPAIPGTTLNRGTYEMIAPGKIRLAADITNNKATILLDGATAQLQDTAPSGTVLNGLGNLTVNSGSLTVRNGKNQAVGSLAQSGTVSIGAGATLQAPAYNQSAGTTSLTAADSKLQASGAANVTGGTLRGIGTVQTGVAGLSVTTAGLLEPGLSGPGTLSVTGKVTLGAGSTLGVDVNGTAAGQTDKVVATGVMAVGGKIDLTTGYTPTLGDTTEILTGSSRTGSFTSGAGGDLPGDISWGATYGATNVVLRASRPSATIGDVSVTEGNADTKLMTFTLTQTESLLTASSVSAQTMDGTALVAGPVVGGGDYEAASGTLTIPFGATTGTFTVPVKGDEIYERDDVFSVGLTSPDNLTLADASATGTISNDEATPRLVAGNLAVVEKDTDATTNGNVPVTLTPVSAFPTTVTWSTASGTASASDYNPGGGTLSFAPGVASRNAVVPIVGDFQTEDDETVQVNLSSPTPVGDAVVGENGVLTIRDDDAAVSVSDVSVDEPAEGTTLLTFTVTLSHVNPRAVGFSWATANGTAAAPGDYVAGSGASSIGAGQTSKKFTVTVNSDAVPELDEIFFASLTNITGGQPGNTNATMTIKGNRCTIVGTSGNDDIWGTTRNDVICGLAGNDTIHPGPGNDEVYGGAGVPTAPEAGNDTIDYSQYKVTPDAAPTATECGVTADLYKAEGGGPGTCVGADQIWNMENITGTEFDDTLRGNTKPNTIRGNGGNDVLLGDAGDDTLVGGADNGCSVVTDICGDAASYVRFVDADGAHEAPDKPAPAATVSLTKVGKQDTGAGLDTIREVESLFGTNSADTLTGNSLANTISGIGGDDVIHGATGNDILFGNDGHDVLHGDGSVDRVFGGDGPDIVNGDDGVDQAVDGEGGDDIVFGGAGNELTGNRIRGGAGDHDFCHEGDVGSPVFAGTGCENTPIP